MHCTFSDHLRFCRPELLSYIKNFKADMSNRVMSLTLVGRCCRTTVVYVDGVFAVESAGPRWHRSVKRTSSIVDDRTMIAMPRHGLCEPVGGRHPWFAGARIEAERATGWLRGCDCRQRIPICVMGDDNDFPESIVVINSSM